MKNFIRCQKYIYITLIGLFLSQDLIAQGCVAIRQFSGIGNAVGQGNILEKGELNISANYRYFKSFRHFRGTQEEPDRLTNNTEVINWTHLVDLNISYAFSERVFGVLSVPYAYNERSSLYEHGRTERHTTYSQGLTDLIIGGGYWLFSGENSPKGNMAIGAGLKIPTGNYKATSRFYNVGPNGGSEIRPVDQSIQLGDGGFGIVINGQGIWSLGKTTFLYYDGFYMLNPRNTNGVQTFRRRESEAIMSVPDQFALRAGLFKPIGSAHGLALSFGGRIEGVPVRDIIGKSEGFRRPGYIVSAEPGASYMVKDFTLGLTVPIALLRNRTRSLTDILDSNPDNKIHGDAAFADYLVNLSLAWRISKKESDLFKSF
ncbi:transporter [Cecembia rubra]|uniref:transporter n=1 Tax=Cecembia rubra TaxID=1485585 RepID=UPI002714A426|nr:transporter [Cecembia rubra]